jgi:hypothetical protein
VDYELFRIACDHYRLLFRSCTYGIDGRSKDFGQRHLLLVEGNFASLDSSQIENTVEHGQQRRA